MTSPEGFATLARINNDNCGTLLQKEIQEKKGQLSHKKEAGVPTPFVQNISSPKKGVPTPFVQNILSSKAWRSRRLRSHLGLQLCRLEGFGKPTQRD